MAKVKWILGVSGGSYIASSRALVAGNLAEGAQPHAYAPGTPEERNLRYNTRYIAPNGQILLTGVLSLILGAICTFIIALAPLYAVAHAWGWLLSWHHILVPSGPRAMTASVTGMSWWLWSAIAGGILVIAFFFWWGTIEPNGHKPKGPLPRLRPDSRDRGTDRAWLVSQVATVGAGLALAMLAAPLLISWLTSRTGSLGTITHFVGFGGRPTWSISALAALIAAVTAVARYSRTGLAKWTAGTAAAAGNSAAAPNQGFIAQLPTRIRQLLMPWLASAVVVLLGAILVLLWISDGARAGYSAGQLLPVIIALVVTLSMRAAANVNRLSMHDFYRWRLADAFAVTREAAEADAAGAARDEVREKFAQATAARLSELTFHKTDPGLVICGTANINALRQAPPGQGGFCITFDKDNVILHREMGLDAQRSKARTSDFEALVGQRRATLFDVSAISGAAVSPLMGSATRHAYRLLFTATNVRLGVWLPHPNVVRDARRWMDFEDARRKAGPGTDTAAAAEAEHDKWWVGHPLLLVLWYLAPFKLWTRNACQTRRREARLWAHVLRLRLADTKRGALWYRILQPTLGLLWAEAAGQLNYRATWMYVTDGGHYDNLGLVEALRRGASKILVLDASGDKADTWFTLGGAMALARSDAGVEIQLDPTVMTRGGSKLAAGQVIRPWAHGTFRRPAQVSVPEPQAIKPEECYPLDDPAPPAQERQEMTAKLPDQGEIWVCKLGWWSGAPWDVRAYAKHHPTYPCDPTLEQLYDSNEFSAYQELGATAVICAATAPGGRAAAQPLLPLHFGGPATNGDAPSPVVPAAQGPAVPVKEKT
ncbi:MAG TPA: hypothetical protein VGJ50_08110 [Streptosporangiaceae bacterium]